jgi:hypothetical protein
MKNKKKTVRNAIVLTLAAALLVTATVFTTLAYLFSTAEVSNVFTVGDVTIEMFESKVGPDGHISGGHTSETHTPGYEPTDKKTANANTYPIVPGGTYCKDPTVYINANSAETILFVKTRNQIANIETTDASQTMKQQMINNGWQRVAKMSNGDWIYVFIGTGLTAGTENNAAFIIPKKDYVQAFDLFNQFTIDKDCNLEQYKLAKEAAVTLTAYAIQADGFTTTTTVEGETVEYVSKDNVIAAWNAIVDKVSYKDGANEIESYTVEESTTTPEETTPDSGEGDNG